jgi:CRISPR-associated protein Cmr6
MTILMRPSLIDTTHHCNDAHAGLLLTRGLTEWQTGEKTLKAALIDKVASVQSNTLYKKAFERWLNTTSKPEQFGAVTASVTGRLMMGLSTGGAIETGMCTHHTYGMPMIAGSSVKGAVRAYADSIGLAKEYQSVLFGADEDLAKAANTVEGAGYLVWHDAWWIPEGNTKPFVGEVVTVHHQEYYGGRGEATDFDSPVPNQQLAVQGSFYFVVEGDISWVALAIRLLRDTLQQQGIGAKRAAGYGFMAENNGLKDKLIKSQNAAKDQAQKIKDDIRKLEEREKLSPTQRKIEEILEQNANITPELALLQKLEAGICQDSQEKREIAEHIKQLMQANKTWKEKSGKADPSKDKDHQRTLKVVKFLTE